MKRGDDDAERAALIAAMDRLLDGTPQHSDGKLTIKSLADEARLPDGSTLKREVLTKKHTELQTEFQQRIQKSGLSREPQIVVDLRNDLDKNERRNAELRQENTRFKTDLENYAANLAIAVLGLKQAQAELAREQRRSDKRIAALEEENQRLRTRLFDS